MREANNDHRMTVAAVLAAAVILCEALIYAFSGALGEDTVRLAIGLGDLLGAGICTALCYVLWRSFGEQELLKRVWLDLGIGLALWTLAEFTYDVTSLILNRELPNPSFADAIWLPGFIPIFVAFWLRYKSLRIGLSQRQMVALAIGFAVLAALSMGFVIVPNARAALNGTPDTIGSLTLGVIYGVGDLLLAMAVGLTIVSLLGGQLSRSWMIVALGFLSIAVGDSMYYSGVITNWYSIHVPVNLFSTISDIAYMGGYFIIAVGLYDQAVLQRAV